MTISSTTNRWSYAGNGVTLDFAYTNKIFADTDLLVYLETIADGTLTLQTKGTHYTVSGAGLAGGGNVSFLSAPSSAYRIIIVRSVPFTQETDLEDDGPFPADTTEAALDKAVVLAQQLNDQRQRSLRQPDNDTTNIAELPRAADRANKYLACDADGNPVAADPPEGGNVVSAFAATLLDDADADAARATLGLTIGTDVLAPTGSVAGLTNKPATIAVSVVNDTTALSTGLAKRTFRMPFAMTLTSVRASVATAQTGGSLVTVDINEASSSILSTLLTFDNGEKTTTTATTAAVLSDTGLADDAEITIDIDQIGDGTAKGLIVYLIGTRA